MGSSLSDFKLPSIGSEANLLNSLASGGWWIIAEWACLPGQRPRPPAWFSVIGNSAVMDWPAHCSLAFTSLQFLWSCNSFIFYSYTIGALRKVLNPPPPGWVLKVFGELVFPIITVKAVCRQICLVADAEDQRNVGTGQCGLGWAGLGWGPWQLLLLAPVTRPDPADTVTDTLTLSYWSAELIWPKVEDALKYIRFCLTCGQLLDAEREVLCGRYGQW